MMYFVTSLLTYVPKNRKCAEVIEVVKPFDQTLFPDSASLDIFKERLTLKVKELNEKYPKMKELKLSWDFGVRAEVSTNGCPDTVFILTIKKVRNVYSFGEELFQEIKLITDRNEGE